MFQPSAMDRWNVRIYHADRSRTSARGAAAQWPYRFWIDLEFALADVRRNKIFRYRVISFPDAKARKNDPEQIVSGKFAGDCSECVLCAAQFLGEQFDRRRQCREMDGSDL